MKVYAIDFGTTNSLLVAADGDQIFPPIPLDPGASNPTILRSVLYFPNMKEAYYGSQAISEFIQRDLEGRLVRSIKKFLPTRSFLGTFVQDRPLHLEDIIGLFLKEMRTRANAHFDQDVESVVLGRPARFSADDDEDRFAQGRLEKAARLAGFKHIEFCPEPVAAAREFRTTQKGQKIALVADFGGGTSDFTVIRLGEKPFEPQDVLAIGGVALAGDSLDGSVMRRWISPFFGADVEYRVPFGANVLTMPKALMEKICTPAEISLLRSRDTLEFFKNVRQWSLGDLDRQKMDRLFSLIHEQLGFSVFEEIERTKQKLSNDTLAHFNFEYPGAEVQLPLRRLDFDECISDRVDRILASLDKTVADAQISHDQIDVICCTGGTAKVPLIRQGLVERYGAEKLRDHNHFHSVVEGLGARARELANE